LDASSVSDPSCFLSEFQVSGSQWGFASLTDYYAPTAAVYHCQTCVKEATHLDGILDDLLQCTANGIDVGCKRVVHTEDGILRPSRLWCDKARASSEALNVVIGRVGGKAD
jgi:hypothetical protein